LRRVDTESANTKRGKIRKNKKKRQQARKRDRKHRKDGDEKG